MAFKITCELFILHIDPYFARSLLQNISHNIFLKCLIRVFGCFIEFFSVFCLVSHWERQSINVVNNKELYSPGAAARASCAFPGAEFPYLYVCVIVVFNYFSYYFSVTNCNQNIRYLYVWGKPFLALLLIQWKVMLTQAAVSSIKCGGCLC